MSEIFGFRPGAIPDWLDKVLVEMPAQQREKDMESMKKHFNAGLKERGLGGYAKAVGSGVVLVDLNLLEAISIYSKTISTPLGSLLGAADYLRFGEGFQKGGWGYVEDGLRLFSLGAPVAGRVTKIARAMLVASGPQSCGITSTMKSVLLGGRKLFAPLSSITRNFKTIKIPETGFLATVSKLDKDYLNIAGEVLSESAATSKSFGGITFRSLVSEFLRPLGIFKEHELIRHNLKSFSKAVDVVKNEQGVMLMQYFWELTPEFKGGHVISVHKTLKGVRFADQLGTFQKIEEIAANAAKLYLEEVEIAAKAGKPFEDAVLQEARVFEAKNNPLRFFEDCITIKEAVLIKNAAFLPLEHVPVMLQATNPNSFLNHIAVPVWEFEYDFFIALARRAQDRLSPKKAAPLTNYSVKNRQEMTRRYVQGGNSDTFVMVDEYRIVSGDTLNSIAGKIYGDTGAVPQIQSANPDLAGFAKFFPLPVGKLIVIP